MLDKDEIETIETAIDSLESMIEMFDRNQSKIVNRTPFRTDSELHQLHPLCKVRLAAWLLAEAIEELNPEEEEQIDLEKLEKLENAIASLEEILSSENGEMDHSKLTDLRFNADHLHQVKIQQALWLLEEVYDSLDQ